jgi:hypothetical protein
MWVNGAAVEEPAETCRHGYVRAEPSGDWPASLTTEEVEINPDRALRRVALKWHTFDRFGVYLATSL